MYVCNVEADNVHQFYFLDYFTFFIHIVSENKVLTHPSSVDTLSTSAAQEDHVSMGGFAARKALQVIEHVEQGKILKLNSASISCTFQQIGPNLTFRGCCRLQVSCFIVFIYLPANWLIE